ncbi:MAG: hypothetical protein U0637_11550 [Phycisphaerales bacterium]
MTQHRVSWAAWMLVVGAGLAVGAPAAAQGDKPSDDGALSGPRVKDNGVQGERRTLTGKGDPKLERAGRLAPRVFERAVHSLQGEQAPEGVRLSAEQEKQIEDIRGEFMGQMRDYIAEHKDEIQTLREKLPPRERGRVDQFLDNARGPGGPEGERGGRGPDGGKGRGRGSGNRPGPDAPPPPHDDAMQDDAPMADPSEVEAAKTRLKELLDGAPKPADAHARVMAVLTEAQRDAVNQEVERLQKEAAEKAKDGAKGGPGGELREELRKELTPEEQEKLKSMTPEQRREFIRQKLEARKKDGGKTGK